MDLGQLEKLHELKEKGILTEDEFEKEKQKLLNAVSAPQPSSAPQAGGTAAMSMTTTAMSMTPVVNISQAQSNTQIAGGQGKAPQSRLVTIILCVFGGWFGIHRFYTGYPLTGILYLCTCGLFGVGVIVDLLWLIFGSYRNAQGQYL